MRGRPSVCGCARAYARVLRVWREYVCCVCAFEGVRVSLLLRGALGMLRLMGCTRGYSRGTPRKCGRAGVLTAAFLRAAHLSTSVRLRSDAVDARANADACALANARADDRRAGRCAVGYELP
jgi:hypothetical protein